MTSQQEADALLAIHQLNRGNTMATTSDILAGIESKAKWLEQDGKFLADYVARLPMQRSFETRAEAAMDDAERALIEALRVVRASRMAYGAKPVERELQAAG